MTLEVEGVVDGGMQGNEALGGTRRLEPLHLAFAPANRLVRNLGPLLDRVYTDGQRFDQRAGLGREAGGSL